MIECTDERILKKRKRGRKKIKAIFLFLFVITILWVYNTYFIAEQVSNVCEQSCYAIASKCTNEAIIENNTNVKYDDIVRVEKNQNGDITLISTNSSTTNKIGREIAVKTNTIMSDIIVKGIPIPLFAFSGIGFISGYGPNVNFKSIVISSVTCDFISKFLSSGINQTLHSLYAEIVCKISIMFPLNKRDIVCKNQVLLTEAVLVGKVPEIYLNKG